MENKQTPIEYLISKCKNSLDKEPLDATEQEIGYSKALNHMILLLEEAKQIEQMTEKTKTNNNTNNIQTKTRWSENKRWLAAVIGLLCVIGFISVLVIYNLFWYVLVSIFGVWLLGVMLVASKDIVDDLIDMW